MWGGLVDQRSVDQSLRHPKAGCRLSGFFIGCLSAYFRSVSAGSERRSGPNQHHKSSIAFLIFRIRDASIDML